MSGLADAFQAWLDARARLRSAVEPAVPHDLTALAELRRAENEAWHRFRTLRLTEAIDDGD